MTVQMHPYRPQLFLLLFGPRSCRWRSVASGSLFTHASWLAGLMASFMRCSFSLPYSSYRTCVGANALAHQERASATEVGKREDETLIHYDCSLYGSSRTLPRIVARLLPMLSWPLPLVSCVLVACFFLCQISRSGYSPTPPCFKRPRSHCHNRD
jgi:hypothetical protein